ncbi:MAG: TRAP transporter large permease subunit [Hydrogenophaga sp.]|nr:TRAP transporter large permease subunit [Hydrogenophaga sp.]
MSGTAIAAGSVVLMLLAVWSGMHVAIALGLVSFLGIWLLRGDAAVATQLLSQAAGDAIASHIFGVVPLFVFAGLLVARADLGRDAFDVAHQLLRRLKGGLGVATVASNAVFAAITGISLASAAVFSRVAVPPMRRHGYLPRFAVGVVAGSSVLGMLIPPSLLMVLYGYLSNQSVGDLFTAGVLPGIVLALAFSAGIVFMATRRPGMVFARPGTDLEPFHHLPRIKLALKALPGGLMIVVVLGGLYGGLFTATEAAAVSAALALAMLFCRRGPHLRGIWNDLIETGHITVSISFLIICASTYSRMLALSGLPQALMGGLNTFGVGSTGFVFAHVLVILVLGMFIDASSILLIVLPLSLPLASQFGLDLVWFGIVTIVAVEVGLLTPPFGLSVYVVHSAVNDPELGLGDVFAGTLPFTLIMLAVLALLIAFPAISLALL